MEKKKKIIMWGILIILIVLVLALNYIKFFATDNANIEVKPIENSSSTAIENALLEIVNNFNESDEVGELSKDGIILSASKKNYSIYVAYVVNGARTTYEFNYSNLNLFINVSSDQKNLEKFNKILMILIKSCQKRINNTSNIDRDVEKFLDGTGELNGVLRSDTDGLTSYQIDITKKIEPVQSSDLGDNLEGGDENGNTTY